MRTSYCSCLVLRFCFPDCCDKILPASWWKTSTETLGHFSLKDRVLRQSRFHCVLKTKTTWEESNNCRSTWRRYFTNFVVNFLPFQKWYNVLADQFFPCPQTKVKSIVKPGCSQDVLKAALSAMASVTEMLTIMSSPSFSGQATIWRPCQRLYRLNADLVFSV